MAGGLQTEKGSENEQQQSDAQFQVC